MVQERVNLPLTQEILQKLVAGDPQLARYTKVTSSEFSIYTRVNMPNVTRWLHAIVVSRGGGDKRSTKLQMVEVY